MCKSEDKPPSAIRADSTISSEESGVSFEDGDWMDSSPQSRAQLLKEFKSLSLIKEESWGPGFSLFVSMTLGTLMGAMVTGFAVWFPFALAPEAARKTYHWAFYQYDESISHFDNTAWTYGTDYGLAVVMALLAASILKHSRPGVSDSLCYRSAGLLLGYCISVIAGGFCHQHYLTVESRNSLSFRCLWTICVGTVSAASGFMGSSGTEVIRKFQQQPNCDPWLRRIPLIPQSFWWAFGVIVTAVCAWGGMSFQRPACDIFIAGITQFPSTFYLMTFFLSARHPKTKVSARIMGLLGFIMNAPLLPMYPLLIQYTDLSLASVNTLLHSWLCVAWSLQGYSLRHMIQAIVEIRNDENGSSKELWVYFIYWDDLMFLHYELSLD